MERKKSRKKEVRPEEAEEEGEAKEEYLSALKSGEETFRERFEKTLEVPTEADSLYRQQRYLSVQYERSLYRALKEHAQKGGGTDLKGLLQQVAKDCFGAGIGEEDCARWSLFHLGHLLCEEEVRKTVDNVYSLAHGFGEVQVIDESQVQTYRMEEFMQRRYVFRHNTMIDAPEYREHHTLDLHFKPVNKTVLNSITLDAQEEGLQLWDRDVQRYVYSNRLPDFSPIEAYLGQLPKWDGKERIRVLAGRIKCDNPQWTELFYRWFLSMVAHWQGRDTEHANSVSPLLVGDQGCGKSTFCLNLLPPELRTYFTDSIDFSKRRDAELYLTRFALINIDEFDQVSVTHQAFLKHLLQKPVVNIRKPYATQVEATKRYASFIATSNHGDLLSDSSGSRRFICIEVQGIINNKQPVNYAQLYAQAVAALNDGERYWMTHEEEQKQMAANEPFSQRPLYEELFELYYRPAMDEEEGKQMSATELFLSLQAKSGVHIAPGQIVRFGRFLHKVIPLILKQRYGVRYWVVEKQDVK